MSHDFESTKHPSAGSGKAKTPMFLILYVALAFLVLAGAASAGYYRGMQMQEAQATVFVDRLILYRTKPAAVVDFILNAVNTEAFNSSIATATDDVIRWDAIWVVRKAAMAGIDLDTDSIRYVLTTVREFARRDADCVQAQPQEKPEKK